MRAAEQQRVDPDVNERRQQSLREHVDLVGVELAALHKLDKTRTR